VNVLNHLNAKQIKLIVKYANKLPLNQYRPYLTHYSTESMPMDQIEQRGMFENMDSEVEDLVLEVMKKRYEAKFG
jgi:hypothetical protein